MNDENLTVALLVRVVDDLDPDVPTLVSAGTQRGRVLSRRRRVALGAVGTALLATGASALGLLPSATSDHDTTQGADPVAAEDRRTLAVTASDLAPTLSRLLPGNEPRTELDKGATLPSGMIAAGLVWNGASVSIGIDASSEDRSRAVLTLAELKAFLDARASGGDVAAEDRAEWLPAGLSPQEWCETQGSRAGGTPAEGEQRRQCTSLGGGNWATWHSDADPPGDDTGRATTWETSYELYTSDGYLIQVQARGLSGAENPSTAPVLSTRQLRDIAESEVWFE